MIKDDVLSRIDALDEDEELRLPLVFLQGKNAKYRKMGVFKRSAKIRESVPCPNGCGECVKVLSKTQRGYLVVCDHGERGMEDLFVPPEEVELYVFDRVTFNSLVAEGKLDYVRPSTPEERLKDTNAARRFLQDVANEIKRKSSTPMSSSELVDHIMKTAKKGDPCFRECLELRELKKVHKWNSPATIATYIREGSPKASSTKTLNRKAKAIANKRKVKRDLESM